MCYWARIGVRLIGLGLVCVLLGYDWCVSYWARIGVSYWARIGVRVIGLGLVCVLLG